MFLQGHFVSKTLRDSCKNPKLLKSRETWLIDVHLLLFSNTHSSTCLCLCLYFYSIFPGCTLLFYETYGKGSPEQELSPRYALLAEDSIVQAVPEHPKKENVFCLSNSYGDVYLFQVKHTSCAWYMWILWVGTLKICSLFLNLLPHYFPCCHPKHYTIKYTKAQNDFNMHLCQIDTITPTVHSFSPWL